MAITGKYNEKELIMETCYNIDEPQEYYAK